MSDAFFAKPLVNGSNGELNWYTCMVTDDPKDIIQGYIPLINLDNLGYNLPVIIGIRISHGKLMEVEKKISKNPHVYDIYDTTGDWDAIIVARFKSRDGLNKFIKGVLSVEHVERTMTFLVLNVVKEEKRVLLKFKG